MVQRVAIFKCSATVDHPHVVIDAHFVLELGLEHFDGVVGLHVQEAEDAWVAENQVRLHETSVDEIWFVVYIACQPKSISDCRRTQQLLSFCVRCPRGSVTLLFVYFSRMPLLPHSIFSRLLHSGCKQFTLFSQSAAVVAAAVVAVVLLLQTTRLLAPVSRIERA